MPSKKGFILLKSIMNMVNATVLTLTGAILKDAVSPSLIGVVIISFICAWAVTIIIPVEKIGSSFSRLFKLPENSTANRLVADIAITFIYVAIINFVMSLLSIGFKMPDLLIEYIKPLPILYIVSYIVSLIVSPLAFKLAMKVK